MKLIINIALSLILLSAVEASYVLDDIKETSEILARAVQESKFIEARDLYTRNLHLYRQGPCGGDRNGRLLRFSNMCKALQKLRTISLQEGNPFAREANDILREYNSNKDIYNSGWKDYNQALLGCERRN